MKVLVAGASGVLGVRVVPLLVGAGHEVVGTTRSPAKSDLLSSLGATPSVCDVYDRVRLVDVVSAAAPDLVLHLLTDLPDRHEDLEGSLAGNARMRTEGTDNLLAAMAAAGTPRLVAQSIAWRPAHATSVDHLEQVVLAIDGVVLRYGQFHGPGTWYPDAPPEPPAVHVDRAAALTVEHLDVPSGTYTLVD